MLHATNFDKFHNFLINFAVGIISWEYEACSWWVEIYPETGPIWELTEWISVLLQILTCLEVQAFWGKWGEITRQDLSVYKHHIMKQYKANCITQ